MYISIHALLAESDREPTALRTPHHKFLSTLSLRRATHLFASSGVDFAISIHALLAESDTFVNCNSNFFQKFLSTLSLRRATRLGLLGWLRTLISIHALLAESDISKRRIKFGKLNFYPRSPCGERRPLRQLQFALLYFYPRSPCGERRQVTQTCREKISISIHALLAESDNRFGRPIDVQLVFLSTLSLRRATLKIGLMLVPSLDFYPRSPCGERRLQLFLYYQDNNFYPRSPCGERPTGRIFRAKLSPISIHALLAESDTPPYNLMIQQKNFYPRSPCGERHNKPTQHAG